MKIKENRPLSFVIITLIYLVAFAAGILTYVFLPLPMWLSLLIADVVATIVTFVFSVIFKNASVYDPYWSVQPIAILVAFALFNQLNLVKICLLVVVCLWGIRLTANWAYTFKNLNHQDWRYTMLQEQTKKFYPVINFVGIHMVPTLIVYACTLPAVYVLTSNTNNPLSLIFMAVSVFAFTMQGVADIQMHKFQKTRLETGEKFIRTGLWKHSRHPNYLGEILMWWGVGLASVVTLVFNYWWLLTGALLNTLLFLFVSIPLSDGRQAKKEGFLEYKKQTRMLLPIKRFNSKNKNG